MSEPRATVAFGLARAFSSPDLGGFSRDDLLFHVVDVVADTLQLDDYELRELLDASMPLSCPVEQQSGELVMMARSDNVGGPLSEAQGAASRGRIEDIGREHAVSGPLALLLPHERAVILPPPALAGVFTFAEPHPLRGAAYFSVIDVMKLLSLLIEADPDGAAKILELLELCREQRLVLSWRRDAEHVEASA